MQTVTAGKQLKNFVRLCYSAGRSPLLTGSHGVGKSEIIEQAAAEMGIDFVSRDLSLMEPPDLTGMPTISGNRTQYAPPSFLPTAGRGILVFEELNRCPTYMRAPCLQLLTARSLNDYKLPEGWLPAAAINPAGAAYDVSDLDPALLARFVQVTVVPDRRAWLEWAQSCEVHPAVINYVGADTSVFDDPMSNPRAWKYVSDILWAAQKAGTDKTTLRAAIVGLVGTARGAAFMRTLTDLPLPLSAMEILSSYPRKRLKFKQWIQDGSIDLVRATLLALQKHLQPKEDFDVVIANAKHWKNLGDFLSDLPGDLRLQAERDFEERGYLAPVRRSKKK